MSFFYFETGRHRGYCWECFQDVRISGGPFVRESLQSQTASKNCTILPWIFWGNDARSGFGEPSCEFFFFLIYFFLHNYLVLKCFICLGLSIWVVKGNEEGEGKAANRMRVRICFGFDWLICLFLFIVWMVCGSGEIVWPIYSKQNT